MGSPASTGNLTANSTRSVGPGFGGNVLNVLLGCQNLGENRPQLNLSQNPARLDIAEYALKVAHARSDALHIAQTFIDGLELLAYLLKRSRETVR